MSFFERFLPRMERVGRHWTRGLAALENGDHDAALHEARELAKLGWSGAFELEARVRLEQRRTEEAVELLERGVAFAPDAARLWHYLAHACKVARRSERSREAYAATMRLVEPQDRHAVAYDLALLHIENDDGARALAALDEHPAPEFGRGALHHAEVRARCALREGRAQESLAIAQRALEDRSPDCERVRATLCAVQAFAHAELGGSERDIEEAIDLALGLDKTNGLATRFLRERDGRRASDARRWKLTLEGRCWRGETPDGVSLHRPDRAPATPPENGPGFFCTCFVIARSAEDALELCRRFEPPDVRATLTLSQATDLGPAPDELLGVERAHGGYTFQLGD